MTDEATEHWIDRFCAAPRERRGAVCEAAAWRLKAYWHDAKRRLTELADKNPEAIEDLIVGVFLAFIPPAAREPVIGKLMPLIRHLQQAGANGDDEYAKQHARVRSVLDRVASSTYEESARPHPFADVDIEPILMRLGHMTQATKSLVESDVHDEETFRKRWQVEDSEWSMIAQEKINRAADGEDDVAMSAAEVSEEQRKRMRVRGQTSVLDGVFARRIINRIYGRGAPETKGATASSGSGGEHRRSSTDPE